MLVRHCMCPPYARLREAEVVKELNKCRSEGVKEVMGVKEEKEEVEGGGRRWEEVGGGGRRWKGVGGVKAVKQ